MADELAGLPEDVREAMERIELIVGVSGDDLPTIRAELLRLVREVAELRGSLTVDQFAQTHQRLLRAEAELAAMKRKIAESVELRVGDPAWSDGTLAKMDGHRVALLRLPLDDGGENG